MRKFILFIFTKTFWVNIGVFLVLFVIGIWTLFSFLNKRTLHGEEIKVPLIIDYHITEVKNLLEQDQLSFKIIDSIYVENLAGGMVVEQNPDSGMMVKDGRKIYLTLSSYSTPKISLPNLHSDDKRNAIAQLTSMGFRIGNIRYVPANGMDYIKWIEINSVKIEPRTRLDIGTKIDLVLAGGGVSEQFIKIPYLINSPLVGLDKTVLNTGLIVGSLIFDEEFSPEDSLKAVVYKQAPSTDDEDVHLGSAINLFITTDYNKLQENGLDSLQNEQNEMDK